MDGGISSVESYVGPVERGVLVDVAGVGWVFYNNLLSEWKLTLMYNMFTIQILVHSGIAL